MIRSTYNEYKLNFAGDLDPKCYYKLAYDILSVLFVSYKKDNKQFGKNLKSFTSFGATPWLQIFHISIDQKISCVIWTWLGSTQPKLV